MTTGSASVFDLMDGTVASTEKTAETPNESRGWLNRAAMEGQGFSANTRPDDLPFAFLKIHMVINVFINSGSTLVLSRRYPIAGGW